MMRRLAVSMEFWSALVLVAWSKWLLLQPTDLSDRAPYHVLTAFADDAMWEIITLTFGLIQLLAVLANKRWPRFAVATFCGGLWVTLGYGLWLGEPSAPSAALYGAFGLMNLTMATLLCCQRRQ